MGRLWRTVTVIVVIFLSGLILRHWEGLPRNVSQTCISPGRDSITACINIRSGMYTGKGFLVGFQYTMLNAFADTMERSLGFTGVYGEKDCWRMLADSLGDIVAVGMF